MDREIPAGVTAVAFGVCAAVLLALRRRERLGGTAIHRRHAPGRLAALGLAVPNLFVLPFGTALGIYAMWVLLHDEVSQDVRQRTRSERLGAPGLWMI